MSSIDHFGINVSDFARAKAFYSAALAPLGISVLMDFGVAAGFGRDRKPDFWFGSGASSYQKPEQIAVITPVHVCFAARSRAEVDAFYQAALAAGARDNGAPGLRPEYHANYYGAFVIDHDGHNVEACYHLPE